MKRKWVVKNLEPDTVLMPEYPALITRLLKLRGIKSAEEASQFLNPDYSKLFDPYLFVDMQKAVARIRQALENKEQIVIYADYDADAVTACAVLYRALSKLGGKVNYYIPDRFAEGYGMNLEAIKKIKDEGASLIITVDCGINAVEEGNLCKELGVDLIITDHHELTGELPQACAIINPKNPSDRYPFAYLTGVGVAYKLVQALFSKIQDSGFTIQEGWEKWLLDLVAIGTVADLQSLTSENRILVSYGLKVLAKTRWAGLKILLEMAAVNPAKVDAYTLGFIIAPRLNAAGRIKHANAAFKLLITDDLDEAGKLAIELNELNQHRQRLTEQILSEAKAQAEVMLDRKVMVVSGSNWPKGVVGLVAGKLCEEYYRPVLVLDRGETEATGSARSIKGFDLVKALTYSKDLLQKYGGHTQAAGLTLSSGNVEALQKKLLEYADANAADLTEPILELDAEIDKEDISWDNYSYLERFGPFGLGNAKPKFVSYGFELMDMRTVGAENRHLRLRMALGDKIITGIAFGHGFLLPSLKLGSKADLAYEIDCNEWNGNRELQLKIIDIIFTNN